MSRVGTVGAVGTVGTLVAAGGIVALVAAGAVAVMVAAPWDGDDSANGSIEVEGVEVLRGSWVVINDGSAPAQVVGTVRMRFEGDTIVVDTGCNAARGRVGVERSVLVADAVVTTRRACEPPLMAQEQWLVDMVTSRPRLELSGPYLALHWGEGERWWLGLEQEGPTPSVS